MLCQSIKAVAEAEGQHCRRGNDAANDSFFNANSLYSSSGTGSVGNDKSVKPVVSGHFGLLLLRVRLLRGCANNQKAQTRQMRFAQITGKFCFQNLLEDLQRLD